jgi:hypothetical protein
MLTPPLNPDERTQAPTKRAGGNGGEELPPVAPTRYRP